MGTLFVDVDLSVVKGLDTVWHKGPSYLDTHTLKNSRGKIPDAFLRGCGLSDVKIEMAELHNPGLSEQQFIDITYKVSNLLTGPAISYYSCFISHSHQDKEFAEKIYIDLQENGVRCWYAPEDMKISDEIRPRIDESIRLQDKFLLILSKHSVASQWLTKLNTSWI